MEPPTSQEQKQLDELCRNFYFVRKREVRMFPGAKTLLKMSIQKYMAKYEVEFLDDGQRLRVAVPLDVFRKNSDERFRSLMQMPDAMEKAKLLTFFRDDKIENLRKEIQVTQIRISGLQKINARTGEETEKLKRQQELLEFHEEAMEKQNRILEEWWG